MNRADHEFLVFRLDPEVAIRWIAGYDAIALPRASVDDHLSRRSHPFQERPVGVPENEHRYFVVPSEHFLRPFQIRLLRVEIRRPCRMRQIK
jgi:hypothetical protein